MGEPIPPVSADESRVDINIVAVSFVLRPMEQLLREVDAVEPPHNADGGADQLALIFGEVIAAHGELEALEGVGDVAAVSKLPEEVGVVRNAGEVGGEPQQNALEGFSVHARLGGVVERLLGDGAVAGAPKIGFWAAPVHLRDHAGRPPAPELCIEPGPLGTAARRGDWWVGWRGVLGYRGVSRR